jgi:hypothetical protein
MRDFYVACFSVGEKEQEGHHAPQNTEQNLSENLPSEICPGQH